MNIMKSKKYAMAVAALQIMVFHLWIPVLPYSSAAGQVERFLIAATFMGVDIFFFVSAYSLTMRPVENYAEFIKNRAFKLLPLFIIAYIAGHFLWFIPSLMVMYIVFPPLAKVCRKRPKLSFPIVILSWAVLTWFILTFIDKEQRLGIFLFRIPSIILGAYAAEFDGKLSAKTKIISGVILTAIGVMAIIEFGYMDKLSVPFRDVFYLSGIPMMIGILLLADFAAEHTHIKALEYFGSISLELYFTQVVLGTVLVNLFFGLTDSRIVTNLITFAITIFVSSLINLLYKAFQK